MCSDLRAENRVSLRRKHRLWLTLMYSWHNDQKWVAIVQLADYQGLGKNAMNRKCKKIIRIIVGIENSKKKRKMYFYNMLCHSQSIFYVAFRGNF